MNIIAPKVCVEKSDLSKGWMEPNKYHSWKIKFPWWLQSRKSCLHVCVCVWESWSFKIIASFRLRSDEKRWRSHLKVLEKLKGQNKGKKKKIRGFCLLPCTQEQICVGGCVKCHLCFCLWTGLHCPGCLRQRYFLLNCPVWKPQKSKIPLILNIVSY